MKESELRNKIVSVMRGWLGYSEANGKHKIIIDLYNTQKPLPVGYKVKYTDEWCATTVTAAGMKAGLHDIILGECSCSRMIALYQAAGRWEEDDAYRPQPGDIIMYDWDDTGAGDNRGAPDHVGIVETVTGGTITVLEGNKGEAVARRTLAVNGRYIRGYCLPDYASKVESEVEENVTYDQWKAFMDKYRTELQSEDGSEWSKEDREWAVNAGIVNGSGEINGLPKYMWKDLSTREQLIALLHRFAKAIGQA